MKDMGVGVVGTEVVTVEGASKSKVLVGVIGQVDSDGC